MTASPFPNEAVSIIMAPYVMMVLGPKQIPSDPTGRDDVFAANKVSGANITWLK